VKENTWAYQFRGAHACLKPTGFLQLELQPCGVFVLHGCKPTDSCGFPANPNPMQACHI